jgi:hypothetical protein
MINMPASSTLSSWDFRFETIRMSRNGFGHATHVLTHESD